MRRLLILVLLISLTTAPVALAGHSYNGSERLVRDLVMTHRSGMTDGNSLLRHEARDRARELRAEYLRTGRISHAGAFDEVVGCWWLGEVAAYTKGYGDNYVASGTWVMGAWHASASHEAVVHGRWTRFGVGVVRDENLRFYAVVFGRPC